MADILNLFISLESAKRTYNKSEEEIFELLENGRLYAHVLPPREGQTVLIFEGYGRMIGGPSESIIFKTQRIVSFILDPRDCIDLFLKEKISKSKFKRPMVDSDPYTSTQSKEVITSTVRINKVTHHPLQKIWCGTISNTYKSNNIAYIPPSETDLETTFLTKGDVLFLKTEANQILNPEINESTIDIDYIKIKSDFLYNFYLVAEHLWSEKTKKEEGFPSTSDVRKTLHKNFETLSGNDLSQYSSIITPAYVLKNRNAEIDKIRRDFLSIEESFISEKMRIIFNITKTYFQKNKDRTWIRSEAKAQGLSENHAKAAQKMIAPTHQKKAADKKIPSRIANTAQQASTKTSSNLSPQNK